MVPDVRGLWEPILNLLCSFWLPAKFLLENDYFQVKKSWPFFIFFFFPEGRLSDLNYQEQNEDTPSTDSPSQYCLALLVSLAVES